MKIKAKQVFFVGAFIVLTVVGYFVMPKDEVVINLDSNFDSNLNGVNSSVSNFGASESESSENKETIFVHIEGAVNSPGIKEVPKGTRVFEVIKLASGECNDADISKINLASIVKDEQKIYVPFKSAEVEQTSNGISAVFGTQLININSANKEQLQQLEGIGPSMAQKILDYREEVGYFGAIEDIKNVSGIGEAKYNSIKDNITI